MLPSILMLAHLDTSQQYKFENYLLDPFTIELALFIAE